MDTKNIHICDYNYDLPDNRIPKFPVAERDMSKLLIYDKGNISQDIFRNVSEYIPGNVLMVFNNAKVIHARLHFKKATGANIEIFLLEPYEPYDYECVFQSKRSCKWLCLVGNLKKWKDGALSIDGDFERCSLELNATHEGSCGTSEIIRFEWSPQDCSFADVLEKYGELPIPPYLHRKTEDADRRTYQTVYSKVLGSVAAPTAGLHFTEDVLRSIHNKGIVTDEITLHVGAGTFRPVKSSKIGGHEMHSETFAVKKSTIESILAYDCCVLAVGTTCVRTLESLYYIGAKLRNGEDIDIDNIHVNQWEQYENNDLISSRDALLAILEWMEKNEMQVINASTQIIIAPGYKYHYVNKLITNFHQPQSTLLLLVSAFVDGNWRKIYDYALSHDFRFLSYGDSSLIIR